MVAGIRRVKQILHPEMIFSHFILFYGILLCTVCKVNSAPPYNVPGGGLGGAQDPNVPQMAQGAGGLNPQQQGLPMANAARQAANIGMGNMQGQANHGGGMQGGNLGGGMQGANFQGGANHGMGNAQVPLQRPVGEQKKFKLSSHPDCQEDVETFCNTKSLTQHNFAVLDCLQGDIDIQSKVSDKCQNLLYHYKRNLTKDDRFESGASEVCRTVFDQYPECKNLPSGQGVRIPCLIEQMDNITDKNCRRFLKRMANIVFGDYQLVWHFHENCAKDIAETQCGRLDDGDTNKPHMQGKTILCLAKKISKLDSKCKKQVLRVAELQSDDYHLDRPLYYACRDAREQFCDTVQAGGGKVFDCLFKHKNSPGMADECKELLTIRQQLIAEDVRVKKSFFEACKHDIRQNHCLRAMPSADENTERSHVLLCLENALKSDRKLSGQCIGEMTQLRKSLMEDYQITPEIVTKCDVEINKYCNKGVDREGRTLHCLMENANPRQRQRQRNDPHEEIPEFSVECKAALETLMREADVGSDFTVDKILAEACSEVLQNDCKNAGSSGTINCLMEKVDSDHMTDECEDRLLEIQFFIVRDFRLDVELYQECHKDAVEYCSAPVDWSTNVATADISPMVFPCLYRHMKQEAQMSKRCVHQIHRVMRRRAKRIDLEPEVEEACLKDLGALCSDLQHYGKGKEMSCLQDNLESIEDEKCEELVREFTEDQDEDLDLDTVLMRACTPMIKKFCEELLKHDAQAGDVMDCLVDNKNHHEMNDKCKAGIEHHQVIQLKDFRFSHRFKEACKTDVMNYCKEKRKKTEIVSCLSEIVRDNVLKEEKQVISDNCRNQLRVEVLSRSETIDLDPELKQACSESIAEHCKGKHAGNSEVIECLKKHARKLTPECHKKIFQREVDEAVQGADFILFRECKQMIKTYCSHKDHEDVFDCLKMSLNSDGFDAQCRGVVLRRAMQQTKDYRLNPSLAKSCRLDIPKFCRKEISEASHVSNTEYEGTVINCLKIHFIKKELSRECHTEIKALVKDTKLDINMDPVLMHACEKQIKAYCSNEIGDVEANELKFSPHESGDKVQMCLQEKYKEGKVLQTSPCGREVARTIEEAHVDINIDPQLHAACQRDLDVWCRDVPSGEGQKMTCLLSVLEDYPDRMKAKCSSLLAQRRSLWEYAAKYAPAESLSELSQQVMTSPAKNYLLGVLMTIIGIIFIVGITCGRVTKRVTREQKTK
ncbi:Golgi apparatus protein 1-like [Mercenaria mercenaria]|uniref:Golgi apparatus protein 1-like n=1 Tax=Mercenaria mercenaria TaxID=6596 RepID=UPI00234E9EDE|nr:Golgi apparatus protein 1-like [Mercenaria mercenaria]